MSDKRDYDQTAEGIAGIPTPPGNEDVAPSDSLNEWVEAMMETIQRDFTGGGETAARRRNDRS